MQRLGFLKSVVSIASPSQGQTLEALTKKVEVTIRRGVEMPDELRERFEDYVSRFRLHTRYPQGRSTQRVELQDAYLSDPRLPAASGAITGEIERVGYRHAVYVEVPTWATRLQLVRDRNYSLTDRGKVLRIVSAGESWDRFEAASNPFCISSSQAFFFLYCLLDADGDLLQLAYRRILQHGTRFERAELGIAAADALEEIVRTRFRKETSGLAKQQIQKAQKTIDSIRLQKGSGYGPRESVATPRVEPLVDCGLLTKPDHAAYVYVVTERGGRILSRLAEAPSVTEFIRKDLASLLSFDDSPASEPRLADVKATYDALKAGLGYVSIRELVVGSIAAALAANRPPHSIDQLESMLLAAPAKCGPLVRLAQGRVGGIAQVRIHSDAFRGDNRA